MTTTEKDWVAEALKVCNPQNLQAPTDIESQLKNLSERRAKCLGVEADLAKKLDRDIAELESELAIARKVETSDSINNYKPIELSKPLSWREQRDPNFAYALPLLMPFSLNSSTTTIRKRTIENLVFVNSGWSFAAGFMSITAALSSITMIMIALATGESFTLALPLLLPFLLAYPAYRAIIEIHARHVSGMKGIHPTLAQHYEGIIHADWFTDITDVALTAHITGAIPDHIKEKISTAKETFGDDIYLIAEPSGWDAKKKVFKPDPLVVGVKGDATFLITHFDMTPLEKAVAGEFTA